MPLANNEWTPFSDAPWSEEQQSNYLLILEWDRALRQLSLPDKNAGELDALLDAEAALIERREEGRLIPVSLCRKVLGSTGPGKLSLDWFVAQLRGARGHYGPLRFETGADLKQYLETTVVPKGFLIASLADVAHRWQLPQVSDLSTGFFLVKRLVNLKEDLSHDRLFIPRSDLDLAGLAVEDLKKGNNDARMQKMLWKQVVRIRDAFAQGHPLIKEVPRKFRRTFKRNWLTGLELVNEIERRKYDLWSRPVELSSAQQFQISVLTFIGKGASHARGG